MFYEKLVLRNVGKEQKPQVVGLLENGEPNSLVSKTLTHFLPEGIESISIFDSRGNVNRGNVNPRAVELKYINPDLESDLKQFGIGYNSAWCRYDVSTDLTTAQLKGILGIPSVNGVMIQPNNWSYKP